MTGEQPYHHLTVTVQDAVTREVVSVTGLTKDVRLDLTTVGDPPLLPPIDFGGFEVPVPVPTRRELRAEWVLRDGIHYTLRNGLPPTRPRDAGDASDWLYERAEEAAAVDLPLERALQAVRDGYSSIEADRMIAEEDVEGGILTP